MMSITLRVAFMFFLANRINAQLPTEVLPDYPFQANVQETPYGRFHYLDERPANPSGTVLFLHGTPTFSYLYRKQVLALRDSFRCIAPDFLGYGFSTAATGFSYKPQDQAVALLAFIDSLKLSAIHLVVHDFGGPIGLWVATQHPERFASITVLNTWAWDLHQWPKAKSVEWWFRGWRGRFLEYDVNLSLTVLLKQAYSDPKRYLSQPVKRAYRQPFAKRSARKPLLVWARALVGASDWFAEIDRELPNLAAVPRQIVWGSADKLISNMLPEWRLRWPEVPVHELPVGHFLQEEAADEVTAYLRGFWGGLALPSAAEGVGFVPD